MTSEFDLICIGSGPSGLRAAIQASKLGKKVAIIEKYKFVGGICLHAGTIPSKTFREAILSKVSKNKKTHRYAGYSFQKFFKRVQKIVNDEVNVNNDQLSRNGIKVIYGEASFKNKNEIIIKSGKDTREIKSEFFLISVGTQSNKPNYYNKNNPHVILSDDIFSLKTIPNSISVIGCGVIGIEYASMFSKLGIKVTLIDGRHRPLEFLDSEIVDELIYQMRKSGVEFKLGEKVKDVLLDKKGEMNIRIDLESGKKIHSQLAITCVGRVGYTSNLNLESINVNLDSRGRIIVNHDFQTTCPNVYSAGDVIGFPSLAATSFEQGRLVALNIFNKNNHKMSPNFPVGVYSVPEVSMVGETEQSLTKNKIPYEIGIARYKEISRGIILGDINGLLKMIIHRETKKILGVHIVGESATELIHIGQCVMELDGDLNYFLKSVFNYPTLAECYKVAALDADNKLKI